MKLNLFDSEITPSDTIINSLEASGSYNSTEWISFEGGDNHLITFEYDISVDGYIEYDEGDYWTPPYSDIIITDFDITLKKVYYSDINDNEIKLELDNSSLTNLVSIIKSYYKI